MKFSTQIILAIAAVFFMMKGGFGIVVAAWRFVIPLLFLGGAYYLLKKAFSPGAGLPGSQKVAADQVKGQDKNFTDNAVIEICPHCLSEVGSCPKCKKKTSFF